jgi:hypothetical protein
MASGWQSKLARLSRMDWDEVRVRAEQEFHKRSDLLMHKMGGSHRATLASRHSSEAPARSFFSAGFSAGDQPASARAALLRQHLPDEASAILREANQICAHRFRLLGYDHLDFGSEIDWHLDPVHGKSAPLEPWFKIPFLDFAAVGDHKVIWELNRHQHLVTLAKARLLSGDEKYSRELMAQWRSWMQANPYPLGINWGSTLEVAFRSLSWIWVDQLLYGPVADTEFHGQLLSSLAFHGRYIERYLSVYFSPNTHLLGEAVTLLILGTLYPQMPRAERWRKSAWEIVRHEAQRQVRPDGVYFEQSLYYHVYALDFLIYARLVAARNGMEIPPAYDAVVGRMLDVIAALAQAGPAEGFGDDDGGRLWNPRRNQTEHMTDPLALGAIIYARDFPAARLTEESIWLFGDTAVAVQSLARKPAPEPSVLVQSAAFSDGGLYVLGDSEPYAQTMTIDAGPQGEGRAGHGHADALSLRLVMDGRRWLVDSGSGVYISEGLADRNRFRGTAAHNTLRVDGADQAIADEPFSWTHLPSTHMERWIAGETFSYFQGSHNGYERLADPVIHRRHVFKIAGGLCLVRDIALGRAQHDLEIHWHFAPDLELRTTGAGRMEALRTGARPGEARLSMLVPEKTVWQSALNVDNTVISPAYGAYQPAPKVRCHARVALPAETATALLAETVAAVEVAGAKGCEQPAEPRLVGTAHADVQGYELHCHRESHGFFFALHNGVDPRKPWSFGPWSSDAHALYCCVRNKKLLHLAVVGGTCVSWQGQPLLQAEHPWDFFEWREQGAVLNSSGGELPVTAFFEELTGGPHSPAPDLHQNGQEGSASAPSSQGSPSSYAERR